jgi:hypothetical protein
MQQQEQEQEQQQLGGSVFEGVEQQQQGEAAGGGGGGGAAQYHSILLDVDSKDNSLGLSAPPASFLAPALLAHLHDRVLLPGGSLCVNVVARDMSKLAALIAQLKDIFCAPATADEANVVLGKVYCIKPSAETVNLAVHAVKKTTADQPVLGLAKQLQALAVSSTINKKNKKGERRQ